MAFTFWLQVGLLVIGATTFVLQYTGGWELVKLVYTTFFNTLSNFFTTMPRPLQLAVFLLFLLFFFNITAGFFLNSFYVCDTSGDLRIPKVPIIGMLVMNLEAMFDSSVGWVNTTADYDAFLERHTVPFKTYEDQNNPEGLIGPKCVELNPRLYVFGQLDLLKYENWIFLYMFGILLVFYFKYMGGGYPTGR